MTKKQKENLLLSLFKANAGELTFGELKADDIVGVSTYFHKRVKHIIEHVRMCVIVHFADTSKVADVVAFDKAKHPWLSTDDLMNYVGIPAQYVSEDAICREFSARDLDTFIIKAAKQFMHDDDITSLKDVELRLALMGMIIK